MGSWKRYHEVMAIVSAGDCTGGKIIGGIFMDTYNKKAERILVMDDSFDDLVRIHQIQNFEFDDNGKLKIGYSKEDIKYLHVIAPEISQNEIDTLIKTTSSIEGWLSQDKVLHKKLVDQFIKAKKYVGIGRYIVHESLAAVAEIYFKTLSDAEKFMGDCEPGAIEILSNEQNILVISVLDIAPVHKKLRDAGIILY